MAIKFAMARTIQAQKGCTPLARFLVQSGTSARELASRIEEIRGYRVNAAVVSGWTTGRRPPGPASAALIDKATKGAVPVKAWVRWRRLKATKGE